MVLFSSGASSSSGGAATGTLESIVSEVTSSTSNRTLSNLLKTHVTSSTSNRTLSNLLKTHVKSEIGETILASTLGGGQDPLTVLDAYANTLGFLYIMTARLITAGSAPVPLTVIDNFCRTFDPDAARLAGDRITILAKAIINLTENQNQLHAAILPLLNLITRFPPSLSYMTTIHPHFVHACVKTQHYTAALPVLNVPISEIDISLTPLTTEDVLKYHYVGSLALLGLKRFEEAAEFLEVVVSAPAQHHPAAIQLEALKKLVLIQLILHGATQPLPRYIHASLYRYLKSTAYVSLSKAFPRTSALNEVLTKEQRVFETDCNLGLVRQVLDHAPRWSIRKLTATYVTLSLEEIGKAILIQDVATVKNIVLSMIEKGEIRASLDTSGTVTFLEDEVTYTPADVDRLLRAAQAQGSVLSEADRVMGRSKDFLSKAIRDKDGHHGPSIAEEELFGAPGLRDWDEGGF
ncbi:hypothetical protein M422DRAFT_76337 [Sphaerobolus stellatus SS14]|uniref:COP9 signalosome complex subunit 3 n=1 Tax=Sphaerobolus stellatus (strain SS14) TaxID=990650 RepID=A0A0C9VCL6_SPHS4|nr:hypothetical protein M422DRAFT_76337 [Sphaerobolus stellatus SS14]